jgi:dTDP-4-dehydrorhamnose 3,5-epimerase-like enzyme
MDIKTPHLIDLKSIGTVEIGFLTVAEFPSTIPFEIKRTYWTYNTPNDVERGNHGHKELEQVIIAITGKVELQLESRNGKSYSYILEDPNKALYIPKGYWRTIQFSDTNSILLCLASKKYDKDDYIRDYAEFKKTI